MRGSRQLEGHVPQGKDLTASCVPLYILYRREELGHVPSRRRDALDWGRPISLNITNPPLKHGQLVAAEGKKWRKNCDGPNLIRSFLISNAT